VIDRGHEPPSPESLHERNRQRPGGLWNQSELTSP
jgi:hypothetical protein